MYSSFTSAGHGLAFTCKFQSVLVPTFTDYHSTGYFLGAFLLAEGPLQMSNYIHKHLTTVQSTTHHQGALLWILRIITSGFLEAKILPESFATPLVARLVAFYFIVVMCSFTIARPDEDEDAVWHREDGLF